MKRRLPSQRNDASTTTFPTTTTTAATMHQRNNSKPSLVISDFTTSMSDKKPPLQQQQQQQQQQLQDTTTTRSRNFAASYPNDETTTTATTTTFLPTWQNEQDEMQWEHRKMTILSIVDMLQQLRHPRQEDWRRQIPRIAKRMELSLYRSANTLQEYTDDSTLPKRVRRLIRTVRFRHSAPKTKTTTAAATTAATAVAAAAIATTAAREDKNELQFQQQLRLLREKQEEILRGKKYSP